MSDDPADQLQPAAVQAAVAALAARNEHHLASMSEAEQADAVRHWHELAVAVLTAASATSGLGSSPAEADGPGRAVIVLEDVGDNDVSVHASFHPELEDRGNGEVAGTPAQIAALELLDALGGEPET